MRYLLQALCACALVGTVHSGASAQTPEEAGAPDPELEAPEPSGQAGSDEGGLSPRLRERTRKKWDPSVYDVRDDPRPPIQYTSAPQSSHSKRAPNVGPSVGLALSVVSLVGGLVMVGVGASQAVTSCFFEPCPETPRSSAALIGTGAVLTVGGVIGIAISAMGLSGHSSASFDEKRTRGKAQNERGPRRLRWDGTRSRVVF